MSIFSPYIILSAREWEIGYWRRHFFGKKVYFVTKFLHMYPYLCLQFPTLFKEFSFCQLTYGLSSLTTPRWKVGMPKIHQKFLSSREEWKEPSERLLFCLSSPPFKGVSFQHSLTDMVVFFMSLQY